MSSSSPECASAADVSASSDGLGIRPRVANQTAGPSKCNSTIHPARGVEMRTKARGPWRADRQPASKRPRMPAGCAPCPELTGVNLRVQELPISQIKLNPRNCKTHPGRQIHQIANSIVAFGFTHPLLVTEDRGTSLRARAATRQRSSSAWRKCR